MELTHDRILHCLAVGRKMHDLSEKHPGLVAATPEEMFLLGYLHDVGYEYTVEQENHATVGGALLREQGYKYWREVFYHGIAQNEYQSQELMLLNYVDMITGPNGSAVTTTERVADIVVRYGPKSCQAENAKELLESMNDYIQIIELNE